MLEMLKPQLKSQIAKTGRMLPTAFACCILIGLPGLTLARDDSKVLMLDTRNLEGYWEEHGKDYSVTLAKDTSTSKDTSRRPLPRQFTICNSGFFAGLVYQGSDSSMWWFKILTEDLTGVWIRLYSVATFKNVATEDIEQRLGIVVNGAWLNPGSYGPLLFNRWHHLCLALDLDKEVISFVLQGVVLDDLEVKGMSKGAPTSLDGRLSQDDSSLTVANYMMGNMQVFGRKLSNEEMVSITSGEDCGREGDYLAWQDMQWDVKGKVRGWVNVTRNEMCTSKTAAFRFVNTNAGTFADHKSICRRMHGSKIPAEVDKPTLEELLYYYRHAAMQLKANDDGEKTWMTHEGNGRCVFYWVPYMFKGGAWVNDYTNQPINFTNWGPNQDPDVDVGDDKLGSCVFGEAGNSSETVGATNQGGDGKWAVHWPPCNGYGGMCSICEKPSQPMLRLRGLCRDSALTNLFTPANDEKGRLTYVGLTATTIVYNASSFLWVASNMGSTWGSGIFATNAASQASGLLGTSEWTVYNDSRTCSPDASYKILLTLTSCGKDEFTCVDANCIPMESRCNVEQFSFHKNTNGVCVFPILLEKRFEESE